MPTGAWNNSVNMPLLSDRPVDAIFRPVLILMSGRSLGFIAAFAIPMVLARVFDQAEFGTYKQLFLVYGTLFGIAQLGMAESLYYFLPSETRRAGRFVVNAMLIMALVGGLSLLGLFVLRAEVSGLLNNPVLRNYLPLIGLLVMLMLAAVVLEIVMTVRKQHVRASLAYGLSDLTRASLFIVPVLVLGTIESLLAGALAFAAIRLGATLVYLKKEFASSLRPDREPLKKHLLYALPFGFAGIIEIIQHNFHMYAVSHYFDTVTFAIYAVGCLQVPLTDILMTSTSNVMMVSMRERLKAGDTGAVIAIWLDSVRKLALIICPLVGVLLVMGHELIVLLFTENYIRSVPVFMVWTFGTLFVILLSDGVLRVFAEVRFLILQSLIRLGLIIAFIPLFLEHFGLIGAVLATLMATAVVKLVALARVKIIMGASFSQLLPWASLGLAGAIAVCSALLAVAVKFVITGMSADVPGFLLLLITGFSYITSYILLLLWVGPLHADEKSTLVDFAKTPFQRLSGLIK